MEYKNGTNKNSKTCIRGKEMSILLITDTQLGMALKNVKYGKWTEKALSWSSGLEPSEKELQNLNKFLQLTKKHNPEFIIHTGSGGEGTSDMYCNSAPALWTAASSDINFWVDFNRSSGGSPDRGIACIVHANNNGANIGFDAEL